MAQTLLPSSSLQWIVLTLRLLGQDYPAIEQDIAILIRRLERRFTFRGIEKDCITILKAIEGGYSTAHEISEKTLISYVTVTKRLVELEAAGVVYRTRQINDGRGRGGDRKTCLFWLTEDWRKYYARLISTRRSQRRSKAAKVAQASA